MDESQEYNPQFTNSSPDTSMSNGNFSYETYTPSKKGQISKIKTPGIELLNYESNDETYSPKPLSTQASDTIIAETILTETKIPEYKAAPIGEKRLSTNSQSSNCSKGHRPHEVLLTSEDEAENNSFKKYKEASKKQKTRISEYVPETVEDIDHVPAYVPTPISSAEKTETKKAEHKYKEVVKTSSGKSTTETLSKSKMKSDKKREEKATKDEKSANSDFEEETSQKHKENIESEDRNLRRSKRSPSKPKRYTEDITKEPKSIRKKPKSTTSSRNKELFGTDCEEEDEEDKLFESKTKREDSNNNAASSSNFYSKFQTPKANKNDLSLSSSSSASKKKRKRDKSKECEQERNNINRWLGKHKDTSSVLSEKKSQSDKSKKSAKPKKQRVTENNNSDEAESPPADKFVMPTKEEMDEIKEKLRLQKEHNEKVRAEFEHISHISAPPKKVDNL